MRGCQNFAEIWSSLRLLHELIPIEKAKLIGSVGAIGLFTFSFTHQAKNCHCFYTCRTIPSSLHYIKNYYNIPIDIIN